MAIVKMKRLRLIGMAAERDELLRQLQRVGCVEIDEPGDHGSDPVWEGLTRVSDTALADREGIDVVPTLILYQKGKAAGNLVAPMSKAAIDGFLQEHLPGKEGV